MPWKPKHPCAWSLCPALTDKQYCPVHQKVVDARYRQASLEQGVDRQYYSSRTWRKIRAEHLAAHPFCSIPGCGQPATEVDHIIPRDQGGTDEESNRRSFCKPHHSRHTRAQHRSTR